MRGKKYFIVLVTSLIFVFSLATMSVPVKAPAGPWVRIYVDQPLGYLPFEAPVTKFTFTINIATSGLADGTTAGIIQWKMDIRVNPDVLDIDTTVTGFPPVYAAKFYAGPGHFLYEFASMMGYSAPSLFLGSNDPLTGYQDEISETGIPSYALGAGDYVSGLYPKLLTVEITSKSDTVPCLIDLIDVMYRTGDGLWHPVDVVEDGFYGQPPSYMSEVADPFDPTAPIGSTWHELWPNYSHMWTMTDWVDNTDSTLSASDQIEMANETGWLYWFHVDAVTITIHFTFKAPAVPGDAEPIEPHLLPETIGDPTGTHWHQLYPEYSRTFEITSWEDTGAIPGVFDPSDQFDFVYDDEPGVTYWAHLDSVTTDIILSQKPIPPGPPKLEFPLGLGLIIAIVPLIPLIYLWRRKRWEK